MKKKVSALALAVFLCFMSVLPVLAYDGFVDSSSRIMDNADVVTTEEWRTLRSKIDEVRIRQQVDIAIMTTRELHGRTLQGYAEFVYEYNDFGYGETLDGVLLLIDMNERAWYITTNGYGETIFTDSGIEYIGEQMATFFSDEDYFGALNIYIEKCDELITMAKNGTPYGYTPDVPAANDEVEVSQDTATTDDDADEPLSLIWIPISIAIGVVIGLVVVKGMKSELKSVRKKNEANSYVRNGSLVVNENYDTFLYSQVKKTEIPKQNNSSSSSGSSANQSSSGTKQGGGGKF